MRLKKSIAVVVVAFAVPVVYLAAAAHPAQHVPMLGCAIRAGSDTAAGPAVLRPRQSHSAPAGPCDRLDAG